MKFEALTYTVHETDYSVRASAPKIWGRSPSPQRGLSSAQISQSFLDLWMWMSLHVMGCLAKYSLQRPIPDSTPRHIFVLPSADPNALRRTVRVNRSILRKLRRLERLRPEVFHEKGEPLPEWTRALSPNQFLDYMIRAHKWCRVKVHNLGGETWNKLRLATAKLCVQGSRAQQSKVAHCNAILTPD